MSLFRKPKRNVRQRQLDSDEEDNDNEVKPAKDDDEPGLAQLQTSIAKFKEKKAKFKNKFPAKSSSAESKDDKKATAQLLSFDEDLFTGDDGEVFRVKKSSQSRRLMKQKKQKPTRQRSDDDDDDDAENDASNDANQKPESHKSLPASMQELEIKVKDNIPRKEAPTSWTLSGREAEALHLEEEDEEEDDEEDGDPLKKLLKSGAIPDAAAIHAARKQRQALRDGGGGNEDSGGRNGNKNYIPINKKKTSTQNSAEEEDDSGDDDERRMAFTGIKSGRRDPTDDRFRNDNDDDEDHDWEEQQIRKAVKGAAGGGFGIDSAPLSSATSPGGGDTMDSGRFVMDVASTGSTLPLGTAVSYNLEGIKGRLKLRMMSLDEVNRRHESDLDKIVDDLIGCQSEIKSLESRIPDLATKHRFYQDLRGYVTDLVECFNEKVVNIKYLEDKLIKVKSDITKKLMDRRREDVRDQMKELAQQQTLPADSAEEAARQRRSAERDGRRRRRQQYRAASQKKAPHYDGMSSDDELSSQDQANLGKSRSEIESQARQIMSDVVEEFSTLSGVIARFEAWKEEDPDSYSDAFVSLCLPKIVSPLVRLQILFWNPLTEHSSLETMEWYTTLANYSMDDDDPEHLAADPDRRLLSLVVEKVVLVKMIGIVKSNYDPLSTSQTIKLTSMLNKLVDTYPTLSGESKQLRELLTTVKERLKMSLDQDVYIPLGYPKQQLENPSSGHSKFLGRQFWSAFKLFKNILCWHRILSDHILIELAINALLSRYLVIGLTITPDPTDVLVKCRFITAALPSEWIKEGSHTEDLKRFSQFLSNLATTAKQGPDFVREVSQLLIFLGEK